MRLHTAALSRAHKVIAVNQTHYRNLLDNYELPPDKVVRAPLPVNLDHFVPDPTDAYNLSSRPRVLFVGVDMDRKGGYLLIEWYRTRGHSLCELTIVTHRSPPRDLPREIRWLTGLEFGSVEHLRIYQASDILCLPSYEDGYGQVLAEAAACGLAIVTTKTTLAHTEVVDPNVTGLVANTPQDCILELESLLTRSELIKDFKSRARRLITDRFQPASVIEQLLVRLALFGRCFHWQLPLLNRSTVCFGLARPDCYLLRRPATT